MQLVVGPAGDPVEQPAQAVHLRVELDQFRGKFEEAAPRQIRVVQLDSQYALPPDIELKAVQRRPDCPDRLCGCRMQIRSFLVTL